MMHRQYIDSDTRDYSHLQKPRAGMPRSRQSRPLSRSKNSLDSMVFENVAVEHVGPDDLRAYEKLLQDDSSGIAGSAAGALPVAAKGRGLSAAERRAQIWIESEAVLAELKRQAMEDGDSSDFEQTRKLLLSQHQSSAELAAYRPQPRTLMVDLNEWATNVSDWLLRMWHVAKPHIQSSARFLVRWVSFWISKVVSLATAQGGRLFRKAQQALSSSGQRRAHRHLAVQPDELQGVRTSFPPSPAEARMRRILGIAKIAVVVAAFLFAVIMIFSTPTPRQEYHAAGVNSYFSSGAGMPLSWHRAVLPTISEPKQLQDDESALANEASADAQRYGDSGDEASAGEVNRSASDAAPARRRYIARSDPRGTDTAGLPAVAVNASAAGVNTAVSATSVPNGGVAAVPYAVTAPVAASPAMNAGGTMPQYGPATGQPTVMNQYPSGAAQPMVQPAPRLPQSGPEMGAVDVRSAQPVLPFVPSRSDVKAAMQRVAPLVARCRTSQSGQLVMKIAISGVTGQVASSKVLDDVFSDTPTAICAMQAIRTAQFPKFQKETLVIRYPFQL
ncbi:MAG: hypothetical protein JXX14_21910 [Deltaproteobacteria bacterium]|nr:hypothetical protein [Deltaproteobacteria bacterium]